MEQAQISCYLQRGKDLFLINVNRKDGVLHAQQSANLLDNYLRDHARRQVLRRLHLHSADSLTALPPEPVFLVL